MLYICICNFFLFFVCVEFIQEPIQSSAPKPPPRRQNPFNRPAPPPPIITNNYGELKSLDASNATKLIVMPKGNDHKY